jgi:hypothetical protein
VTTHVESRFESGGDVPAVFATLTSPQWPQTKADRLRDGSRVVQREERRDGGLLLVVSRELPAGVPGFLERFLPEDGRVTQTDDWGPERDGVRRGTWSADIPGAPAQLGGTMRLEPTATGSRYTVEGEVRVSVPLVGGKAERFIAEMVERLAEKECQLLRQELGV